MTKHAHLRSLSRLCRHFGGRLAIVSQRHYDRLFEGAHPGDLNGVCDSPFTCAHGIHWRKKVIYTVEGREEIGSIIHEMGHVFADPSHPKSAKCKEWRWFGWEVVVARSIGAGRVWSQQNGNYHIATATDDEDWGQLSAAARRAVIIDRLAHAKKIGVIDSDGAPRSVR